MRNIKLQHERSSRRKEALICSRISRHSSQRSEPPCVGCYKKESGSAFIIVLWISFGLVSLALYFGHSMVSELRASDNRVSGLLANVGGGSVVVDELIVHVESWEPELRVDYSLPAAPLFELYRVPTADERDASRCCRARITRFIGS